MDKEKKAFGEGIFTWEDGECIRGTFRNNLEYGLSKQLLKPYRPNNFV